MAHTQTNPNSLANLKPQVAGEPAPANAGRPKGASVIKYLKELATQEIIDKTTGESNTQAKALAITMWKRAHEDKSYMQELLNRIYGKVTDKTEIKMDLDFQETLNSVQILKDALNMAMKSLDADRKKEILDYIRLKGEELKTRDNLGGQDNE